MFRRLPISLFSVCLLFALLLSACGGTVAPETSGKISVVAAENMYGNLVQQIGGDLVQVKSILSDPNVDPHAYESTVSDAQQVADAQLVILNGGGYDSWMEKLLESSPNEKRVVLNVYESAPVKLPENEHVWYSIENARALSKQILEALKKADPTHASQFESNYQTVETRWKEVADRESSIKQQFAKTPIASTESIFQYLAQELDLTILTPADLQMAIAEEEDPPAASALQAEEQIRNKLVKVLVYNAQNTGTITVKLLDTAKGISLPVVSITETMPVNASYQSWMLDQLKALETALQSTK